PSTASSTPSVCSRSTRSIPANPPCASAAKSSAAEEAARLTRVRDCLHAADAARGDDRIVRGGVCRVPCVPEPPRRADAGTGGALMPLAALGDCPVPKSQYDQIVLGHGSGGRLSAELIRRVSVPGFGNEVLAALEDQPTVRLPGSRVAFTTDSYVVRPLFFPG